MKGLRISIAVAAVALAASGCTKQDARRVTDPIPRVKQDLSDIREAQWITGDEEIREAASRAAKNPMMQRAVQEGASDPRLSLLREGIVGAIGTAQDGSRVRFTLLPYQYRDDPNHAVYFVLVESGGAAHVESFELIRNRRPGPEEGFESVNSGEHGLWMKHGPTYIASSAGVVRRAPERFNFAKFGWCFVGIADRGLGMVRDGCNAMGNFPGCVSVGSAAVIAGAAIYCAYVASRT